MLEKIIFNFKVAENQEDLFSMHHKRFVCRIKYNSKQYTFNFQCNASTVPSLEDCLECLYSDSQAYYMCYGLEDFCKEFGYYPDRLKEAKKAYNACKKTYNALHRMFTEEELGSLCEELFNY